MPTIGITQSPAQNHPRTFREKLQRDAYFIVIRNAGGTPVLIDSDRRCIDDLNLDGILFSGGGDINPKHYQEASLDFTTGVDDARDQLELALFHQAMDKEIPILGICRGLQLINIALGGSLHRDLPLQLPTSLAHNWSPSRKYLAHSVNLDNANRLQHHGFNTKFLVNSLHHQGIRTLGKNLTPIAWSSDGLIEAVELTGHRFGLAVQWHPEWLFDQKPTRCLFESFIHACEHTKQ